MAPISVPAAGAARTTCSSVALVGDSTFFGYPDQLLADLGAVGVVEAWLEIDPGRSVVETLPGQENGASVAARVAAAGFDGCWIIGLGTNDAANIAAGSGVDAAGRVQRMLDATQRGPILWIDASTVVADSAWARSNMLAWNDALRSLAAGSDRITVAAWDAVAASQPWFVADGIHPNADGRAARSRFVADQLVAAFPA